MKILHLIATFEPGGAEKLFIEMSKDYNNDPSIELDVLILKKMSSKFLDQLSSLGINILNPISSKLYDFNHIKKINSIINNYDLVQVHLVHAFYYLYFSKVFTKSKTKIVFTEHNVTNRRRDLYFFKFIDKFVYKKFDKIVCISEEVKNSLYKHTKNDSNFIVIENGINIETFRTAKKISNIEFINFDSSVICQVSSFTKQKDQITLIKSLKFIDKKIKLILVGDGPERVNCERLVKELNLEKRVLFTGIRLDVPNILKSSKINILSSVFEGLPLVALEAMSTGNPFLGSDVPGINTLIKSQELLFKFSNEKSLAKKITILLTNKRIFKQNIHLSQEISKVYDFNKMINKYKSCYLELHKNN
tara:strand:- start:6112 stop:7197 length:1086 start_codon:yes stop_codon:yes gene_type:complete